MIPEDPSTYPDDENTTQPAASNRNTPDPTIEPILDDQQSHSASVINSSPHPPAADPIEWTSDELDFDQLIEVGNTRLFEQHLPSLATIWGVENEELLDDYVAKEHECVFQLSGASLHTLINILECTVPPLRGQRGTVRLTLETKRLSGRSYYNEAFCDAYVDLVKPAHLVDGHAKLVFVVAFDDLCAMSKGIGRQARLTYSTKEHQLIVSSERFERPLQIEPERLFIDHSGVSPGVTENRSPVRLPSSFLLACLTYVSSQTPTNTFDSPINVTQVRNGLAISGTSTATAIARYKGFEETNITVHNKNLRQLLQYLRQIAGQEVRSRLLDNHHLIDANSSTLGFTRTWKLPEKAETPETSDSKRLEQQFPPVESLLVFDDYKHEILFDTKALLTVLRALMSADEPNLSVRLALKGDDRQPKCAISVKYADQKEAKILVESQSLKPCFDDPFIDISLSLKQILDAVVALQGRQTKISVWEEKQIVNISDSSEFSFQTLIGLERQDSSPNKPVSNVEKSIQKVTESL